MKPILYSFFLICMGFTLKAQHLQSTFYKVGQVTDTCPSPVNLVVNPDFNLGNTGFTSTLIYSVNCTAGYYYVGTSMQSKCSIWPNTFVDHTTGTGNFQIIDGNASAAPQDVWKQTVNVNSGVNYTFSFWAKNLYSQNPFPLGYVINGVQIATTTTITPLVWTQYTTTWTATASGTVSIAIRQITADLYRDFGLDDINFSYCNGQSIGIASLETLQNKVNIFPNPSTGIFIVNLKGLNGPTIINVYDLMGNRILNKDVQGSSNSKIDLIGYSKGIYFAEILYNGGKMAAKLIIQ